MPALFRRKSKCQMRSTAHGSWASLSTPGWRRMATPSTSVATKGDLRSAEVSILRMSQAHQAWSWSNAADSAQKLAARYSPRANGNTSIARRRAAWLASL